MERKIGKKRLRRGLQIDWSRPWVRMVAGREEKLLLKVLAALLALTLLVWAAVNLFRN